MKIDLHRDNCEHWKFYSEWIQGRTVAAWTPGAKWNPTARNTLNRAKRAGMFASCVEWINYNHKLKEIHEINTSTDTRQGRPMNTAYFEFPTEKNIINSCRDHGYHFVCTFLDGRVLAYCILHQSGELCNTSTIIGHADYLKSGIMYVLMERIQSLTAELGAKVLTYGEWDSGTVGLRYWKHATGFNPMELHE